MNFTALLILRESRAPPSDFMMNNISLISNTFQLMSKPSAFEPPVKCMLLYESKDIEKERKTNKTVLWMKRMR